MGRRFLTILFTLCLLMSPSGVSGQAGTVIVKPALDECSRTKLTISLFGKTSSPDKVLFVLKGDKGQDTKAFASQDLIKEADGKYHWTGVIPFRDYVAELYSVDKKTFFGRYSFNTETSSRKFITDKLSEIVQLRQEDGEGGDRQGGQVIQVTNINVLPGATLMQILVITDKGGVMAQYLGAPTSSWASTEKIPAGTYRKIILQFSADGCRLR